MSDSDLQQRLKAAEERIALLESTLRNATDILNSHHHLYVKQIYERFPEFKPVHRGAN